MGTMYPLQFLFQSILELVETFHRTKKVNPTMALKQKPGAGISNLVIWIRMIRIMKSPFSPSWIKNDLTDFAQVFQNIGRSDHGDPDMTRWIWTWSEQKDKTWQTISRKGQMVGWLLHPNVSIVLPNMYMRALRLSLGHVNTS